MTASLPTSHLTSGTNIPIKVIIDNATKKKLSGLKVYFLKRLVIINPSIDSQDLKVIQEPISTTLFKECSFNANEEYTTVLHVTVPSEQTILSSLSELHYSIQVSLSTPLLSNDLTVDIPVVLVHPKALEEVFEDEELKQENLLPEPTLPNTDCIDLDSDGQESFDTLNRNPITHVTMMNERDAGLDQVRMEIARDISHGAVRRKSMDLCQVDRIVDGENVQPKVMDSTNRVVQKVIKFDPKIGVQTEPELAPKNIVHTVSKMMNGAHTLPKLNTRYSIQPSPEFASRTGIQTLDQDHSIPVPILSTGVPRQGSTPYPRLPSNSLPSIPPTLPPPVPRRNSVDHFKHKRVRVISGDCHLNDSGGLDKEMRDALVGIDVFEREKVNIGADTNAILIDRPGTRELKESTAFSTITTRGLPPKPKITPTPKEIDPSSEEGDKKPGEPSGIGYMLDTALAFLDLSPRNTVETTTSRKVDLSVDDDEVYLRNEDLIRSDLPIKYGRGLGYDLGNCNVDNRMSSKFGPKKSTLRRSRPLPLPKPLQKPFEGLPKMPPRLEDTFFDGNFGLFRLEDEDKTRTIRKARIVSEQVDSDEDDLFWNS